MYVKPGGWFESILFVLGVMASTVALAWSLRGAPNGEARFGEAIAFGWCLALCGGLLFGNAQRSRARADVLYPRRSAALLAPLLGALFPAALSLCGWALGDLLGTLAGFALLLTLPWLLSRGLWTSRPPGGPGLVG
jgi:hypothetical protein